MQIWNVNKHTGIVGVFNLQGSSWDRSRRQYFVHDATPPTLDVLVCPRDVEPFRSLQHQASGSATSSSSISSKQDSDGASSPPSFACYSNQSQQLMRLGMDEGVLVELSGIVPCPMLLYILTWSFLWTCCSTESSEPFPIPPLPPGWHDWVTDEHGAT